MSLSRRGLFGVLAGAIAAPYVARAGVLMPVRSIVSAEGYGLGFAIRWNGTDMQFHHMVAQIAHETSRAMQFSINSRIWEYSR